MTRQTKTPRQRAEETLAAAERRVAKATTKLDAARAAATEALDVLAEAKRRLTYAKADPALPTEAAELVAEGGDPA